MNRSALSAFRSVARRHYWRRPWALTLSCSNRFIRTFTMPFTIVLPPNLGRFLRFPRLCYSSSFNLDLGSRRLSFAPSITWLTSNVRFASLPEQRTSTPPNRKRKQCVPLHKNPNTCGWSMVPRTWTCYALIRDNTVNRLSAFSTATFGHREPGDTSLSDCTFGNGTAVGAGPATGLSSVPASAVGEFARVEIRLPRRAGRRKSSDLHTGRFTFLDLRHTATWQKPPPTQPAWHIPGQMPSNGRSVRHAWLRPWTDHRSHRQGYCPAPAGK